MFRLKQFVSKKFCLNCRNCCRYSCNPSIWAPKLLEQEKRELNLPEIKLAAYKESYICGFLNSRDNLCCIYVRRPLECRLYPFLLNRCRQKIYLSVDLNCPFIKNRVNSKEFKRYLDYLIGYFGSPRAQAALNSNLGSFSCYQNDNVMNLAEL